jgi:hypothetical protein
MKPIDIIISMAAHGIHISKGVNDIQSLMVVFVMISKIVDELPGDHSAFVEWMNSSIPLFLKTNDHRKQ